MKDSFFQQFFEGPPQAAPETPSAATGAASPPPPAQEGSPAPAAPPQAGRGSEIESGQAAMERALAAEREKALTYEIKFKEMQNAQSAVEEMFEKLWSKANKERTEEELRLVRERSQARADVLETRLDEFQKKLFEMLGGVGAKSTQMPEDSAIRVGVFEQKLDELRRDFSEFMAKSSAETAALREERERDQAAANKKHEDLGFVWQQRLDEFNRAAHQGMEQQFGVFRSGVLDLKKDLAEQVGLVRDHASARSQEAREDALDRWGSVEGRLKELQGQFTSVMDKVEAKSLALQEDLRRELLARIGTIESRDLKLIESRLRGELTVLAEGEFSRLGQKMKASLEMMTEEVRDRFFIKVEESLGRRLSSLEAAQGAAGSRCADLEKAWGILFNDVKEMAATLASMKGSMENIEAGALIKMRREFETQVYQFSDQWNERLAAMETRILRQTEQFHEAASAELRGAWTKEIEPAREALLTELRGSMEWQQVRTLWERVEDLGQTILKFGETAASARTGAHKDIAAIAGEIESMRLQVRTANQAIRHLEESLRMALQMIQAK